MGLGTDKKWIEIIHETCGKPAILCRDKDYYGGEITKAEDFKHLNGDPAINGELPMCESCGMKDVTFIVDKNNKLITYDLVRHY